MKPLDAGIEQILITDRLHRRQPRTSNHRNERRAFAALARETARDPRLVPQKLVNVALDLCDAGSAGISVVRQISKRDFLDWDAVAGELAVHGNVVTPRDFSPCGAALETKTAQLFHCPGRIFTYLNELGAPMVELLVVPIHAGERALGTLWVASHDKWAADYAVHERQFDTEDVRLVTGMSQIAAVALQRISALQSSDDEHLVAKPLLKRRPPHVGSAAMRWGRRLASTLGVSPR